MIKLYDLPQLVSNNKFYIEKYQRIKFLTNYYYYIIIKHAYTLYLQTYKNSFGNNGNGCTLMNNKKVK